MSGSVKCAILWCILVRVGGDSMIVDDNIKNRIEIATAFSDGYNHGKRVTCETIISWLLENAASYGRDPQFYDALSLVIELRDYLNNQVKDGRTSGVSV